MNPAVHSVDVVRVGSGSDAPIRDVTATEEPLEIRLGDKRFVVIMRTPGADRELAAGFLLAERIVQRPDDIAAIRYCKDERSPLNPAYEVPEPGNVLSVWLVGDAAERAATRLANRRPVASSTSCGVCGRQSIDDLVCDATAVRATWTISRELIASMPDGLRAAQDVFEETGGLHAAGLFDRSGRLIRSAEDVGRHNAVDKVIGAELLAGHVPLADHVLFVSGRTSFEIIQKALVAGIPVVASVSAPSSLAIELARESSMTLVGFVRSGTFNIYTGADRIAR